MQQRLFLKRKLLNEISRSGYTLLLDGRTCTDVDECKENPRICNGGKCTNTQGSYSCFCTDGLITASGGKGCIGKQYRK